MGGTTSATQYETPAQTEAAINNAIAQIQTKLNQMVTTEVKPFVTSDSMKSWVTAELKSAMPTLSSPQVSQIAANLISNNAFLNSLTNQVSNSGVLAEGVAGALTTNQNFNSSLQSSLVANPTLANSVANVLANTPTYAQKLQGPPGTLGTGNITFGGTVALNNNTMFIRGDKDTNHVLQYDPTVDGPRLTGCGGKLVSTCKGKDALLWDSAGNVTVPGSLNVGNWSIYQNNNGLCFKKGGQGDTMCLYGAGDDVDRLRIWMNSNNSNPYFYVNQNKSSGFWTG